MKLYKLILMLCLPFMCFSAYSADCYFASGGSYNYTYASFGSVYVQRDAPVGTTLARVDAVISNGTGALYTCQYSAWNPTTSLSLFNTSSSLTGVYNTNIYGVGIKITSTFSGKLVPFVANFAAFVFLNDSPFSIELVKTVPGAVSAGDLNPGTLMYLTNNPSAINFAELDLNGINTIIPVACSINTPNMSFPIGDVSASQFGSIIGYSPPQTNTQNLGLECDAQANINVVLTGTQNADVGDASVLALNNQGGAGTASGLGVQLLYNNTPLALNSRIILKQSNGGQETFPITARYYQTRTAVTPGDASTSATLTLTYQ